MQTKFKIVEIPDYILAVSDEIASIKDYIFHTKNYEIIKITKTTKLEGNPFDWLKIIAYQPKNNALELLSIVQYGNMTLKELNGDGSYYECIDCEVQTLRSGEFLKSQGVELYKNKYELDLPLLPEIVVEDDVEKFVKLDVALDLINDQNLHLLSGRSVLIKLQNITNNLQKAATKVYSEEDLRKAIRMARQYPKDVAGFADEEIIQSLKKPTPTWFVAEMEKGYRINCDGEPIGFPVHDIKLKTTTINGKTYLVGKFENE
jgi:hypothetical protein